MVREISGKLVDPLKGEIYEATLRIANGKIVKIFEEGGGGRYIVPPLVDSHIHIESSMLVPSAFAVPVVRAGVVATVSDPHEIANVLGLEGVKFMISNAESVPVKIFFSAPSCVPASPYSFGGAALGVGEISELLDLERIKSLGEVMNFPGVINRDGDLMEKIEAARRVDKPIDGHAPGLVGEKARAYFSAGITTDHESTTLEEALEKIRLGVFIQIREGSAAKNFDVLAPLIDSHPESVMLCSDDRHPDSLSEGSINLMVRKAIQMDIDPVKVFLAASVNPIRHYKLPVGYLQEGHPADFVVVDDLESFEVVDVYINGVPVVSNGIVAFDPILPEVPVNRFDAPVLKEKDIRVKALGSFINVIEAYDGSLITGRAVEKPKLEGEEVIPDVDRDILKIVVVNRYGKGKIGVGFVRGFGLKRGAIASTVAHDSHNIVAVGTDDRSICMAVDALVERGGGLAAVDGMRKFVLELPIAGLMSNKEFVKVLLDYREINRFVERLGSCLSSPFMTLPFMALEVIPKLKMTDSGLFDAEKFKHESLWV